MMQKEKDCLQALLIEKEREIESLKKENSFLKEVLNTLPNFIAVKDKTGKFILANKAFAIAQDLKVSDIEGKRDEDFIKDEEKVNFFKSNDKIVIQTKTAFVIPKEEFIYAGTDQKVWLSTAKIPILDKDHTVNSLVIISTDITDRVKAEEKLQKKEQLLQLILENIPQHIFWKDRQSVYISCNTNFAKVAGLQSPVEIEGLTDYDLVWKKEETDFFRKVDREVMDSGVAMYNIEEPQLQADGTEAWLRTNKIPLKDKTGEVIGILGTFENITQAKNRENLIKQNLIELNKKNEKLEKYIKSNMQLENFAYIASHDLKAPLRTITSFSQLLARSATQKLTVNEKEFLDFIVSASKNLGHLIDDLLMYSRVNSEKHQFNTINLNHLLQLILADLRVNIQEKKAIIEATTLPNKICVDLTKMRQLFQNLIANAIKFAKPNVAPKITISCECTAKEWTFCVSDNGIGIEQEYHEKIFLLFRKLHDNTTYQGTGIGLALCKTIVEQHNGRIWIDSELGKGTAIHFTIAKELGS